MKLIARILSALMIVTLAFGAVSVSADDEIADLLEEAATEIAVVPTDSVYLIVEGPDELCTILLENYPMDGSVTVGDVIADLFGKYYPDIEVVGLEEGAITSVNGLASGAYGGDDGWDYAMKFFGYDAETNAYTTYIDYPEVSINDYVITGACTIILYYGNGEMWPSIVNIGVTEDDKYQLLEVIPVIDENNEFVALEIEPLPYGTFTFTEIFMDTETVSDEGIVFTADENGVLPLSVGLLELPNGVYFASAGKQSDVTVEFDGELLSLTEVIRYSDVYFIEHEEVVEEDDDFDFKRKMMGLLAGIGA